MDKFLITPKIEKEVPKELIAILRMEIEKLKEKGIERHPVQVFRLKPEGNNFIVCHEQEEPIYINYLRLGLAGITPFTAKIFVIYENDYSVMLFPEEL